MPEATVYTLFAVCRAQQTPAMKAPGFYYYHTSCWDSWDFLDGYPTSDMLSTEETPLDGGYLRLVPIVDITPGSTCVACHEPLQSEPRS